MMSEKRAGYQAAFEISFGIGPRHPGRAGDEL